MGNLREKSFTLFRKGLKFHPIMNTKKFLISALSLAIAASCFAWSKKSENTGNLGRAYISVSGGAAFNRYNIKGTEGAKDDVTGASASVLLNAPIFKPGINTFRKISWLGVDGAIFCDYDYSGKYEGKINAKSNEATVGAQITPYLNFEFGLPVIKAIKPFASGRAGYTFGKYYMKGGASTIDSNEGFLSYGFSGGVEVVILDSLSLTPAWNWYGNREDGIPCYHTGSVELSYWFSDQFCTSLFWVHSFGRNYADNFEQMRGETLGVKLKIGFLR